MAHADALVSGGRARDQVRLNGADESAGELDALLNLAERVERAMRGTAPSEQYVARLRRHLLEGDLQDELSVWMRIRRLPPHTQLAAGIGGATLTAGVVILAARSVYDALGNRRNRRTATT